MCGPASLSFLLSLTSSFTVLENMADLERGEAVRLTNEEERKSDNAQTCYTKEELEGLIQPKISANLATFSHFCFVLRDFSIFW